MSVVKNIGFLFAVLALGMFFLVFSSVTELENSENVLFSPPAGVDYEGHDIKKSYQAGDSIEGVVNLSFTNARGAYEFTNNINDESMTLLEFLEAHSNLNKGSDYECSTSNCLDDYTTGGTIDSLAIEGSEKVAGFMLSGQSISQVSSAKLTVNSNVAPACGFSQLKIDVLNDNDKLIVNDVSSGNLCEDITYRGCFDASDSTGDVEIDNNLYCEKILLPAAPSFKLKTKVMNSTTGEGDLEMVLYRVNDLGVPVASCDLPRNSESGTYESLACNVDYAGAETEEYYVCIRKADASNTNYKIRFETTNVCGTNTIGGFGNDIADYDINVRAFEFGDVQDLQIQEAFSNTYNFELADYISAYIFDFYNGDCTQNCAVPIRFLGEDQNLLFSDIEIKYTAQQGTITNNEFHSLQVEPVSIESGILALNLEEFEIEIPEGADQETFKLYLDGGLIFEEAVGIEESFSFDVNPKFVAFGSDTLFGAETSEEINSSTWDFGDGSLEQTVPGAQARHQYTDTTQSQFELKVTLRRNDGVESTRYFTITVGDAQEIANITIQEYRNRIALLDNQIKEFAPWIQTGLDQSLDLLSLNASLRALENDFEVALTDEEYEAVMLGLLNLQVPESLNTTQQGSGVPLLIGFDNIEVSYIEQISGKTVSDARVLEQNIAAWMNQHFNAMISFEEVAAVLDDREEVVLTVFSVSTNPIDSPGDSYLIFGNDIAASGKFMTEYNQKNIGGSGTYISLLSGQEDKTIEFYILGSFEPSELGAYISPEIAALGDLEDELSPCDFDSICEASQGENKELCPADCGSGRWGWFAFWIIILLFVALIIYIILQEWYKRHYEKHLFKRKDDMYNLINYVYNARKAGIKDSASKSKLAKSGWKGEQIRYVYKKLDGKRTGMLEIPMFKFAENKKVRAEIAKRQGGKVDARFIKRTSFRGVA